MTIDDGSPPRQRYELEVDGETSALVDVMEACGKPLIDARDNFPVTPPKSVVWVERPRPNPSDYPVRASSRGINGRATVSCQVQEDGRLDLCVVEGETPPRYGFGQAALKAAAHGRVTVPTDPQGGWRPTLITFTVRFDMR